MTVRRPLVIVGGGVRQLPAGDSIAPAEGVHDLGSLGSAVTIDLALGDVQVGTVNANVTITLPSIAVGAAEHLTLILHNTPVGGPYSIIIRTPSLWQGTIMTTSNGTKTLTVTPGGMGLNAFINKTLTITSGAFSGESYKIESNGSGAVILTTALNHPNDPEAAQYYGATYTISDTYAWIGGSAPDLDDATGARNILVFTGAAGQGWIGDGGAA